MKSERRHERRKILDFEEFPLYAEFFSGIEGHFYGHIQNISPSGLCVMLLNCRTASPPNTKGNLHLIYMGKTVSVPAKIKWIDTPNHFIRFTGIEADSKILETKLKQIMPNLFGHYLI